MNENNLEKFINLGQQLYALRTTNDADVIAYNIPEFLKSLEDCGLKRTVTAANTIREIKSFKHDKQNRILLPDAEKLRACVETVRETLREEAKERILVTINTSGVLQELKNLDGLNESQMQLRSETVACVERGTCRAAIVMGWNLA